MATIIPFRTREELEKEKRERIKNEWRAWLVFEREYAEYHYEGKNKSFLF